MLVDAAGPAGGEDRGLRADPGTAPTLSRHKRNRAGPKARPRSFDQLVADQYIPPMPPIPGPFRRVGTAPAVRRPAWRERPAQGRHPDGLRAFASWAEVLRLRA